MCHRDRFIIRLLTVNCYHKNGGLLQEDKTTNSNLSPVHRSTTNQKQCLPWERLEQNGVCADYSKIPESQWIKFNMNWKFCSAIGAFIPMRSFPLICAVNMAASPKKAARPEPNGMTAPCSQPPTGIVFVSGPNSHAFSGIKETKSCGNTNNGCAEADA